MKIRWVISGALIIIVGVLLNLIVMALNDWNMPVDGTLLAQNQPIIIGNSNGLEIVIKSTDIKDEFVDGMIEGVTFQKGWQLLDSNTRANFLADIIAAPYINLFGLRIGGCCSIGDIIIFIGVFILLINLILLGQNKLRVRFGANV